MKPCPCEVCRQPGQALSREEHRLELEGRALADGLSLEEARAQARRVLALEEGRGVVVQGRQVGMFRGGGQP